MTAPRYLLLAGPSEQLDALLPHARAIAHAAQLTLMFDHPEARLFCPIESVVRNDPRGIVIGSVFARDARALADTSHATLLAHHWGNYLALETGRRRTALLRAPFGELGCYHWSDGRLIVAASDLPLLSQWAGQPPTVDWQGVARHLLWSELRTDVTCLSRISELQGGDRLLWGQGPLCAETCWSPWDHAVACAPPDFGSAADQLRRIAIDCVGRLGSDLAPILVQLSGGLDSSIVAAALARAGVRFDCVTFVTEDPTGDERVHARAVAAHLGVQLREVFREVTGVDLTRSNAAHLPRPTGRSFAQVSERIALEAAGLSGAGAIFRGGGGDNVFCFLQSVRPLVDQVRTGGIGSGLLGAARDLCQLTGAGLGEVTWRTLRQLGRPLRYPLPADARLLAPDLRTIGGEQAGHRWLDPPDDMPPGKVAHVALLLAMANHREPLAPAIALPLLSPLMAQPLVEHCLRIPSWWWFRGGNNRAVARAAFARDLPAATIARRSKGTPDSFAMRLFEANSSLLRSMLLDGLLAREGLIDREAVEHALTESGPIRGHGYARLLQLADVEAWARSWQV